MSDNCAVPPDRRFQKGRAKTGGRKKGDKYNAIRKDLADKLRDLNFDPVEEAVKIAKSRDCPAELKARICVDLLQYLHPKRKAVELSGPGGGPIDLNVSAVQLLKSRIDRIATRTGAPRLTQ